MPTFPWTRISTRQNYKTRICESTPMVLQNRTETICLTERSRDTIPIPDETIINKYNGINNKIPIKGFSKKK